MATYYIGADVHVSNTELAVEYLISCDISASYADKNDMNDDLADGSVFSSW